MHAKESTTAKISADIDSIDAEFISKASFL